MRGMNLVSTEPVEWECDLVRGYWGYSVHVDNGVWPDDIGFPAFTHEQMIECKRIQEACVNVYDLAEGEEIAKLEYDQEHGVWLEIWRDATIVLKPFEVDGFKLFALGDVTNWVWGECSEEYDDEYVTV